jgi:hypothetical protein
MTNLHTVVAAEKHVKSRAHSEISDLYKLVQKPALFSGQVRTYQRKDDEGEDFPQERQHIQMHLGSVIDALQSEYEKLINITAQKDVANQSAKASVVIDDAEVLPELPITTLLFLEKTLVDMRSLFENMPILDGTEEWTYDLDSGVYKSGAARTHRTKKMQRPVVLYDATDKHPAQTLLITEDEVVGYWSTQKVSTAMPVTQKKKILEKIDLLLRGVKDARERANDTEVTEKPLIAKKLFDFVLGGQ